MQRLLQLALLALLAASCLAEPVKIALKRRTRADGLLGQSGLVPLQNYLDAQVRAAGAARHSPDHGGLARVRSACPDRAHSMRPVACSTTARSDWGRPCSVSR